MGRGACAEAQPTRDPDRWPAALEKDLTEGSVGTETRQGGAERGSPVADKGGAYEAGAGGLL
eukprot:3258725-Pyramimonas_sp.AAC.1